MIEKLNKLRKLVETNNNENLSEIKETMHEVVPTYKAKK